MVTVGHGHRVVPHGGERRGDRAPVSTLLLYPERQPNVTELRIDPGQVGAHPGQRRHEGRATGYPSPGGGRGPPALEHLYQHRHHQQHPDRADGARNESGSSCPPPATGPGRQHGHHRTEQQRRVGIPQDQRVRRRSQRQEPHRSAGQRQVALFPADQDQQCGHGGEGAQIGDQHQGRSDTESREPPEDTGCHGVRREEAHGLQA